MKSRDELTPYLERQLNRIELIGNAEAELAREEQKSAERNRRRKAAPKVIVVVNQEERHRIKATKIRVDREAVRIRRFGIIMLCLSPVFTVAYVLAGFYAVTWLAFLCMLVAGLLVGFAASCLYFANRRQQMLRNN